jgi:hypothetical protein
MSKTADIVAKFFVKGRKYSPVKFANFAYIFITRGKNNHFRLKNGYFSRA